MTRHVKGIVLFSLAALVCAGMLARYLERVPKRHYCDFRVYHHAAQVFLQRGDIYTQDDPEITPFKYSPFFAFLVSPLGLLPIKDAAGLFFILNFIFTALMFRGARKLCMGDSAPPRQVMLVYALSLFLVARYILLVWDSGQVPILICGLVLMGLYMFFKGKDVHAGALIAAAVLFKYLPALFIPYFIARKKFRAAGLTCLFIGLWLVLPALYAGWDTAVRYLGSWLPSIISTSLDHASYFDFKNQSLISMILRTLSPSELGVNILSLDFRAALMLAYAACILLYCLALIPAGKKDTRLVDAGLLFAFMPLFNPNGWMLNFSALAFPYILLLNHLRLTRWRDRFVLACVALSFVFTSVLNQEVAGDTVENFAEAHSFVTIGALLVVVALLKLKFSPVSVKTLS